MEQVFHIVDAFTNSAFNGAQIAVFPQAEGLGEKQMLQLAKEMNLSQSVFIFPPTEKGTSRKIRIFTPQEEINFAGQAIVATDYVLASREEIKLGDEHTAIDLELNSGILKTNVTQKEGKPSLVQFSTEAMPVVDRFTPTEAELADILSLDVKTIDNQLFRTRLVSCGTPFLVVPIKYYDAVRRARFDYSAWSQSAAPQTAAQEILLFSRNPDQQDVEFHLRLVGPRIGHEEDPPVGGSLLAFAAYLCSHEHILKGTYTFTIDRGTEETRRSVLNLEMDNKGQNKLTLRVGGEAVLVAEGKIKLPDKQPN